MRRIVLFAACLLLAAMAGRWVLRYEGLRTAGADAAMAAPLQPGAAGPVAPALAGDAEDWLNTGGNALRIQPGTGHVYLIDFWEYTCVNCLRTLPYVKAWHERYAKDGLVVIGIHTPEFGFARDRANVAAAVRRLGITYPVLVDSAYRNWQAWQGEAGVWPRKFLVDSRGRVVYDHAGEGDYGSTEAKIQALLREARPGIRLPRIMEPVRAEDRPGAVCYPTTPEMYAGARGWQQGQLGNVAAFQPGSSANYRLPPNLADGRFYLTGRWQTNAESVRHARETTGLTDAVAVRYHALGCNAVIKPEDGRSLRVYVSQDGRPLPRTSAGEDIAFDEQGRSYIQVDAPRMYSLVKNPGFGHHVVRLATDSAGLGLYSFTFTSCTTD